MNGFILEYSRADANSPGGLLKARFIVVAASAQAAFDLVGDWGKSRTVIESGPKVLEQARKLGLADNEARTL
jgi:hypothetical protein